MYQANNSADLRYLTIFYPTVMHKVPTVFVDGYVDDGSNSDQDFNVFDITTTSVSIDNSPLVNPVASDQIVYMTKYILDAEL
jgi:hypothetical protein